MIYKNMVKIRNGIKFLKSAERKLVGKPAECINAIKSINEKIVSGGKKYKKGKPIPILEREYIEVFCKVKC